MRVGPVLDRHVDGISSNKRPIRRGRYDTLTEKKKKKKTEEDDDEEGKIKKGRGESESEERTTLQKETEKEP